MKASTFLTASFVRFRAWLVTAIVLSLLTSASAVYAQTPSPAYYSTGGQSAVTITQPSTVAAGGAVTAGVNAADGNLSTFATLQTNASINVGVPVALRLRLEGEAPAGYRAGMIVANTDSTLSLAALSTVRLRTYLNNVERESRLVRAEVLVASLGATTLPTQLEFTSTLSFDAVEIEVVSVANITRSFKIFYAYGVQPGVQTKASGYLSRFESPTANEYSTSTATGPLVALCLNTDVTQPEQVADFSLTNFATLRSTASVSCNPAIRATLAGVPTTGVPGGYYAGFVIGQNSVLDVNLLNNLEISTYFNNVLAETRSGLSLLQLTLLSGNRAQVSFRTAANKPFNAVRITRVGALNGLLGVSLLDDLQVYYAFGLDAQAFEGRNPIYSNFNSPALGTDYSSSSDQRVTVGVDVTTLGTTVRTSASLRIASVDNPQFAADNTLPTTSNTTNYAQLNTLGINLASLGLGSIIQLATNITTPSSASIKLKVNGTGRAGNRVGFVVSQGAGLLDLNALQRLTISTYDASNQLIETKTGSALLSLTLLGASDLNKISFLASRDFTYAQLTVTSVVSVLSNTRVYYAFAEDVPLISVEFPLPVELTSFTGKWANGAAELNWATASEKNSSHFVVERSTGRDAAFQPIGQVAAAGNSSSAKNYRLRDAEAGAQGVPTLYYRLRQVDFGGKEDYSPVVAIAVGKLALASTQLELYPNPAPDAKSVMVRCPNLPATGGTVQTYSQLGQLVSQVSVTETTAGLALPTLAPGLYHVVLRDATGQQLATQRLVVGGR